ncbi:hypothetical protein [Nevskia sp.]|uniref:hypothetical protein n=1 Tax=Nevskia sp. TaxID=1929292 RepID=UPI0025F61801|nr:hypothetical protein [Nevskia sp.]
MKSLIRVLMTLLLPALLLAPPPASATDALADDDVDADARRPVPAIRQVVSIDTESNFGTQVLKLRFQQPTLAGSAIFLWSQASIDGQTQNLPTFTDDRGNRYIATGNNQSDTDGRVNAAQGTAYAPNIAAGTQEITATWTPFGDYRSVIAVEITGVSEAPFLGGASSIVFTSGPGVDDISSGRLRVNRRNALLAAVSCNVSQRNPQQTVPFVPNAGTGMTSTYTFGNYGERFDYCRFASSLTGRVGFKEALFSSNAADQYFTFMAVFR